MREQADRAINKSLASHWIAGRLFMERLLGHYGCGMVMLEAYHTNNPEVTAEYVSQRLDNFISPDTARRRLTEMVKAGSANCRKEGRTVLFTLEAEHAEVATAFIRGETVVLPIAA